MQGWIKFHRKLLDHELWNDVSTFRLFTLLLLKAAHKDGVKVSGMELKEGQYLRSYRKLAEDLSYKEGRGLKKYSVSTVKRCVQKLVDKRMVSIQETELGTLMSVLNYARYQDSAIDIRKDQPDNEVPKPSVLSSEAQASASLSEDDFFDEDEENNDQTTPNAFEYYEANIGAYGGIVAQKMVEAIQEFGEELVIKSIEITATASKPSWGYCEGIHKNWRAHNVKTIDDAIALELEHGIKQGGKRSEGKVYQNQRSNGRSAKEGKSADQIYRELEEARKAWGG